MNKWNNLTPLTPNYLKSEHEFYAETINSELLNDNIKNIALSGTYGVGKSSILKKVVQINKHRAIELSLSTLSTEKIESDDIEGIQSQTNIIQKEIVKQLLYSVEPHKVPGSRFNRIESFSYKSIILSIVFGFSLSLALYLANLSSRIPKDFLDITSPIGQISSLTFLFSLIILIIQTLTFHKIKIGQITAGPASITLDSVTSTYFDQYIDEIVYFFEKSKKTIVIFEDIDRFENSNIFESLKSLNTLLNSSRENGKKIKFIYALKDSIFDNDKNISSLNSSNRTKFFDLIIPVVPFMSQKNSRDHIKEILKDLNIEEDKKLIEIVGKNITDMRLLKNIKNEYIIFRDIINPTFGKTKILNEKELLSIIIYKNINLSDFEKIKSGDSKLEEIHQLTRSEISKRIRQLQSEISYNNNIIESNNFKIPYERLGKALHEKINLFIEASNKSKETTISLNCADGTIDDPEFTSESFWKAFLSDDNSEITIRVNAAITTDRTQYKFKRNQIEELINTKIDYNFILEEHLNEIIIQNKRYNDLISNLRTLDTSDLLIREHYLGANNQIIFREAIKEIINNNDLIYKLIENSYINRNFFLYTTKHYQISITTNAYGYIIHNIYTQTPDTHYPLSDSEVQSILDESWDVAKYSNSLLNIDIITYLLKNKKEYFVGYISNIDINSQQSKDFIKSFSLIENKETKENFFKNIAKHKKEILTLVNETFENSNPEKIEFFDHCLKNLNNEINYDINDHLSEFINTNKESFKSFKSDSKNNKNSSKISEILKSISLKFNHIKSLPQDLKEEVIRKNLFIINRENLKDIQDNISLDDFLEKNTSTYTYIISNLRDYNECLIENEPSIIDETKFEKIISDVLSLTTYENNKSKSYIEEVIKNSSEKCLISDITKIDEKIWEPILKHKKILANNDNIIEYINKRDKIDSLIAPLITTENIINVASSDNLEERTTLSKDIISARSLFESENHVLDLLKSLNLEIEIEEYSFTEKDEDFIINLIKSDILHCDKILKTFLSEQYFSWNLKKEVILKTSSDPEIFVTSDFLANELDSFFNSSDINDQTKAHFIRNELILSELSKIDQQAIKKHFEKNKHLIEMELLKEFLTLGIISQEEFLDFFKSMLETPSLSNEDALEMIIFLIETDRKESAINCLSMLGGDYRKITEKGHHQVKFDNSSLIVSILEFLKDESIVSSFDPSIDQIKVHMCRA